MSSTDNIYVAIVDDDESICRSLNRLLRAANFLPVAYSSAEAFLADWKHPRFDCLLLDIQMKGMSGIELKEHLDRGGTAPPVIYITAHDDPEAQTKALAAGCEGFFRKTTPGSEIIAAIRSAAARFHSSRSSVNRPSTSFEGETS
jgi:FixJ family two-component response regulator